MTDVQKPLTRQQRWRKLNPSKYAAHIMVEAAKRRGEIEPQPCEVCGKTRVDAHHPDYRFPLDVRWLCRKHHIAAHKEEGKR